MKKALALWVCLVMVAPVSYCDNSSAYGPGLGADGLGNTVVGGTWGNSVSFRFRAERSASVQSVLLYLIPDHVGYSAGTGGRIEVTLNADDGTLAHNPSTAVLACTLLQMRLHWRLRDTSPY
jgi:hypothetical protein